MPIATHPGRLWLIRHGETEWSRSGAHTGRTDLPLTETGERTAEEIGEYLRGRKFALVLTSPMQRAFDTCRLAGYGEAAQVEPNLREWDYGVYEGRKTADIRQEAPGWTLWRDGAPGGETAAQVAARARIVIERALRADGDAILFGHGHLLRVLAACWLDLAPEAGAYFALTTGTISILGHEREAQVISRWNQPVPGEDAF
jgi:broad specificity phosphatase PhoE